jgi:hypothetical protein
MSALFLIMCAIPDSTPKLQPSLGLEFTLVSRFVNSSDDDDDDDDVDVDVKVEVFVFVDVEDEFATVCALKTSALN